MNYESISICKQPPGVYENYTFHDSYVRSISMDYENAEVTMRLENPFYHYFGDFRCENCIYLNVTNASLWEEYFRTPDTRISEGSFESDKLIDILLKDTRKGYSEKELFAYYHNNATPSHFCYRFLTNTGDKIIIIATRICWKNLGVWPVETGNK